MHLGHELYASSDKICLALQKRKKERRLAAATASSNSMKKEGLAFQKIMANNLQNPMPLPSVKDEEESRLRLWRRWLGKASAMKTMGTNEVCGFPFRSLEK